jgi:hypothetical protein
MYGIFMKYDPLRTRLILEQQLLDVGYGREMVKKLAEILNRFYQYNEK